MTNLITLIKNKDLDAARASINKTLYARAAEKIACKKIEVANSFKGK